MEPTTQGAARDMQETRGQAETRPDGQTGDASVNGGENAKSTVMRATVQPSADQGKAAPGHKHKWKVTFGSVLFVIGAIDLIVTVATSVASLSVGKGNSFLMDTQLVWITFQLGGFVGIMFMALGKGLMLLQELVNRTHPQDR